MLDKLSAQKRMFLAVILSLVFFLVYDYFFIPKPNLIDVNTTTKISKNDAPVAQSTNHTQNPQNLINNENKALVKVDFDSHSFEIDDFGRISNYLLKDSKFVDDKGNNLIVINNNSTPLPLEIRFSSKSINDLAFKNNYVLKSNTQNTDGSKNIVLEQKLNDIVLTKNLTFYKNGSYDISVSINKNDVEYFITPGFRPNLAVDGYTVHGVLLRKSDDSLEIIEDGDLKSTQSFLGVDLVAASDRYYTTLFYEQNKNLDVVISPDKEQNPTIFIKKYGNFNTKAYIGPKDHEILKSISPKLLDTIEYGWFTFIAKPMFLLLSWLHGYIGNWGWAIVVLTIIIRIILFPLTYKGMVSMNKLKDLAPKLKELQAKYKGNPQKLNASMMELYKKHGANPMGGCLPILLQIPIFFAIYRVLSNAIELKGAEWIFWIKDLAVMDPFFVLPILMGISMFVQQKLTPTNFTDPMQEKIMKFLPLIFTFFFVTFPAGLTLYWVANNLCSIGQQMFVNRIFAKQKGK